MREPASLATGQRGVLGAPLHLLTGKGGVGKTSLAAALALEARARGGRPVIVELGHRSSLPAVLGLAPDAVGHVPSAVRPGVFATNVSLEHALGDYLARRVRPRALAHRIAQHPGLRTFFDAAPAVPELLTLEHIEALLTRFDPVIVDLDATGHALMFLELPRLLASLAPKGPIGELVRGLGALLTDPQRTRVHLVTLPLALPIEETLALHAALRERGSPLGVLVVNRRAPRPLTPEEDAAACALLGASALDDVSLQLALDDAAQWDMQQRSLARLDATEMRRVELPELSELPAQPAQPHIMGRLADSTLTALGARMAEAVQ